MPSKTLAVLRGLFKCVVSCWPQEKLGPEVGQGVMPESLGIPTTLSNLLSLWQMFHLKEIMENKQHR